MSQRGSIWKNRKFSRYAVGTLFNSLGNAFFDLAIPLLIYNMTQSLALMGTMAVLLQLPKIVLGPLIGTLVDRMNPKRVLFGSYTIQIVIISLLPLADLIDRLSPVLVLLVGFLLNGVNLFARSANFVITPLLYGDQRVEANAAFTTVWTSSMLTGPVIGGMLLPFFSPMGLITLDLFSFFIMIFCLYLVGLPSRNPSPERKQKRILQDMTDGFRVSLATPNLRWFVLSITLCAFAVAPQMTLVIYHLKSSFDFADASIGYFTACAGFGLFSGTLLASYLKRKGVGNPFVIGYVMITVGLLLLAIPYWYQIPAALFLVDCGSMIYIIGRSAIIQTHCPQEYLGRVNSTFQLVEQIAYPIGMALSVAVIGAVSMSVVFAGLALLTLISLLVLFRSRLSSNKAAESAFVRSEM